MKNRHGNKHNGQIKISDIANYIIGAAAQKDKLGFTLSPKSVQEVEFDKNTFLVSIAGFGTRFTRQPTKREILKWLTRNYLAIQMSNHFIGGWRHEGIYYLDVTIPVIGIWSAIETGFMNNQDSIYDAYAKKTIFVKYPKRRAA